MPDPSPKTPRPMPTKRALLPLAAAAAVLVAVALAHACGTSQPGVSDAYVKPLFRHDDSITNCVQCHESVRPPPPHVATGDCVACHVPSDSDPAWTRKPGITLTAPVRPSGAGRDVAAAFTHVPPPTRCIDCHAKEQPVPSHAASGDCVACHKFPQWK